MTNWEFQPTHELSLDFEAIKAIIERALASHDVVKVERALQEALRFLSMYQAKCQSAYDSDEGLIAALRRIRAITTNALPHNIDGKGGEVQLIEGEKA